MAGYIVALRTGTVMFGVFRFADIAVLRKALESSPIAQAIVMYVKVNFMIVGYRLGSFLCCLRGLWGPCASLIFVCGF